MMKDSIEAGVEKVCKQLHLGFSPDCPFRFRRVRARNAYKVFLFSLNKNGSKVLWEHWQGSGTRLIAALKQRFSSVKFLHGVADLSATFELSL